MINDLLPRAFSCPNLNSSTISCIVVEQVDKRSTKLAFPNLCYNCIMAFWVISLIFVLKTLMFDSNHYSITVRVEFVSNPENMVWIVHGWNSQLQNPDDIFFLFGSTDVILWVSLIKAWNLAKRWYFIMDNLWIRTYYDFLSRMLVYHKLTFNYAAPKFKFPLNPFWLNPEKSSSKVIVTNCFQPFHSTNPLIQDRLNKTNLTSIFL